MGIGMGMTGPGERAPDRSECLRLLASARVGRVGITSGALPVVLPVIYSLDDDTILIWCREGSMLHHALQNRVVAFEAGEVSVDDGPPRGWSVTVTGMAIPVTAHERTTRPDRSGDGRDDTWIPVAIATEQMTGMELPSPA
jgi:uncharacterized protein